MEDLKESNKVMVFGTVDGDGFTRYKIANELNCDAHLMLRIFKSIFPSKLESISFV